MAKHIENIDVYWVKCRFPCNGYISHISMDTAIVKWGHRNNFQMLNAFYPGLSIPSIYFAELPKTIRKNYQIFYFHQTKSQQTWNFLCRRVPWATAPWTCRKTQLCTVVLLNRGRPGRKDVSSLDLKIWRPERVLSSWWFQPIWKILVKNHHLPK